MADDPPPSGSPGPRPEDPNRLAWLLFAAAMAMMLGAAVLMPETLEWNPPLVPALKRAGATLLGLAGLIVLGVALTRLGRTRVWANRRAERSADAASRLLMRVVRLTGAAAIGAVLFLVLLASLWLSFSL